MDSYGMHFQLLYMIIPLMKMIRTVTLGYILNKRIKQQISQLKHLLITMGNGRFKTLTGAEGQ